MVGRGGWEALDATGTKVDYDELVAFPQLLLWHIHTEADELVVVTNERLAYLRLRAVHAAEIFDHVATEAMLVFRLVACAPVALHRHLHFATKT